MAIDGWTLLLQLLNALLLVWLLQRFLFKPVATMIASRKQAIAADLDAASSARDAAEAAELQAAAAVDRLSRQRDESLAQAGREAAEHRETLLEAARTEAASLRASCLEELDGLRRATLDDAFDDATALALDIANRLLERLPERARVDGFMEGLADSIARLPETERQQLHRSARPLLLAVPRRLTEKERISIDAALASALGGPIEFETRIEPELVAGLELEGAHCAVRNSFRDDLRQLATTLHGSGPVRRDAHAAVPRRASG